MYPEFPGQSSFIHISLFNNSGSPSVQCNLAFFFFLIKNRFLSLESNVAQVMKKQNICWRWVGEVLLLLKLRPVYGHIR